MDSAAAEPRLITGPDDLDGFLAMRDYAQRNIDQIRAARGVPVSPVQEQAREVAETLEEWWLRTAKADHDATVPKAEEYGGVGEGSADLRIIGYALAELCDMHDAPEPVKLELAVWFYDLGKVARLVSDYKQKRPGKADTWLDGTVYPMMARRIQETGQWP